jgi:hypothetical protein
MRALVLAAVFAVAPTGAQKQLVAIWLDRGSPYMELRADGSGRVGMSEAQWTADKELIHVVPKEGDPYELQYTLESGGKNLKLLVSGLPVVLERSKKAPAAKAPPPPKPPSEIDKKDEPDAGTPKKKKGKK